MRTSEPPRRAGTRRVPMKSLPAGPGLENANLDSGKVRRVALQQRRGAAYPQRKYTRAPTPSSMMFLEIMERTCEQESKASALQTQAFESSSNGSKCTQEIQKKAGFGKARQRATASMLRRCGREAAAIVAGLALTLRSLTDPASSMVKPACIRNTSIAALLMD